MARIFCASFGIVLLLVSTYPGHIDSARILGLFPHVGKSHFIMFEELMKVLASRGHDVVVLSHFPQKTPLPHYTDINVNESIQMDFVNSLPLTDHGNGIVGPAISLFMELTFLTCKNVLEFPPVQKLIKSNEKFDLIMYEIFNSDCFLGFVHKFKTPSIALSSSIYMPWANDRFGNPDNPSYIGNHFLPHSDKMNFLQRLKNTIYHVVLKLLYHYYIDVSTHEIAKKHFGESLPPFVELAKNTSMLLINTHHSVHQVRPLVPAIVEVAGLHIKPPKKLPQDLEKFISEAKHGVVLLSFGSTVRTATLTEEKRRAIVSALSELPQRVLWKWEDENLADQPKNVMIRKWLPQHDVLAHPNVKVFWTHGGLMGTLEALYSGVPMVSTPLFGDQGLNVQNAIDKGIAVKLEYTDITKESVLEALTAVLNNPSYHENAKRTSRIYHDRPRLPIDEAIYWTEYVVRHRGAYHLRSAAVDLPLYQYLLLDVLGVLALGTLVALMAVYIVLRTLVRLCCGGKKKKTTQQPRPASTKKSKAKKQ